jgi:hypothetical protein
MQKFGILFLLLGLTLAACGGGDDDTTDGVASVSDLDESVQDAEAVAAEAVADTESEDGEEQTAEEAALALSACMRDNGFAEFPDPVIGDNGAPNLRAAIAESGVDFGDPDFREQIGTCSEEVGGDNFGAGARGNQREQVQEQLLTYTQCLRDEGLDVGDLGAPGQGQGQTGDGDGAGAGRPQRGDGARGDRGERIANALGLDAEDPATTAALDACAPVLEEALAGIGPGPGNG